MIFKRVTIIGVGLIGASLAMALRKAGLAGEIVGFGRSESNLRSARDRGIIDRYSLALDEACRDCNLLVLATPVGRFQVLLSQVKEHLAKGTIIMDVGSVKAGIVPDLEAETPDGSFFVGAHPIAGSDRSGIDPASAKLFEKALCFVTPTENTDENALKKITDLWTKIGARVKKVSPREHDMIFSSVSHLPHMAAYAMVNTVNDIDPSFLGFAGSGFRDSTRIAMSSADIWVDICRLNRSYIIEHLEVLIRNMDSLRSLLEAEDYGSLEDYFTRAKKSREGIE